MQEYGEEKLAMRLAENEDTENCILKHFNSIYLQRKFIRFISRKMLSDKGPVLRFHFLEDRKRNK